MEWLSREQSKSLLAVLDLLRLFLMVSLQELWMFEPWYCMQFLE